MSKCDPLSAKRLMMLKGFYTYEWSLSLVSTGMSISVTLVKHMRAHHTVAGPSVS